MTLLTGRGFAGDESAVTLSIPKVDTTHLALNLVGTSSCAAASCHGGGRLLEGRSFASYQIWARKDPHSRAYEVLSNDRSIQMMALLFPTRKDSPVKATEEARCLNCHVTTETSGEHQLLPDSHHTPDGVGCESCHGPAKQWLGPHSTIEWQGLNAEAKASLGFIDTTTDLAGRIQICADCHVGRPGRDVNHDLLAAGHPRLDFEFSSFHANLPKHWDVDRGRRSEIPDIEHDPAFEAKAWLTGQLVTAQTSLRLLQDRTSDERPWPELSEYACFSCHHDLQDGSWYQSKRRSTGRFAWGTWNFGTFPALTAESGTNQEFKSLQELMEQPFPERREVHQRAGELEQALGKALSHASSRDYSVSELDRLTLHLIAHSGMTDGNVPVLPAPSWDQTAQLYLAAVAIAFAREKSAVDDPLNTAIRNDLEAIRQELLFGKSNDSPREYSGRRIDEILKRLQGIQNTLNTGDTTHR